MNRVQVLQTDPESNVLVKLPVLSSIPLRSGYDRNKLSRYGDDCWDLTPAVFRENARRCHCTVIFGSLADPVAAEAMRAYLYARLNVRLPGWSPLLPPASIRQAFNHMKRFFEFLTNEQDTLSLAKVDQALLDQYAKVTLASKRRQPAANVIMLKPIWHLYHYRAHLPHGGLKFEPWPGQSAASLAGYNSRIYENRTARIPEAILTPLLGWASKYVQEFSRDIFAARAELSKIEQQVEQYAKADRDLSRKQLSAIRKARIKSWLAERAREGRGIPVWAQSINSASRDKGLGTPINWRLLNLVAGVDTKLNPGSHLGLQSAMKQIVKVHMSKYGTERGGFNTSISLSPDTRRPWRPSFDHKALKREERMLQTACYILCAYLTGMRDCEIQAMRPGCLDLTRSEDGLIERYRVRSTAYKARRAVGDPADWITIAPVAEAIEVLELLSQPAAASHGIKTLWPVLNSKPTGKTHVSAEIVNHLNEFRDHVNAVLAHGDRASPIPTTHEGKPFRITTRQFRRTLAWHIANRPFGTIAGMIQYKHASVAVFEGYAGSSHSGFQRQVDQERRYGQLDDILEYFDAHQVGDSFSGPASTRIETTIEGVAQRLSPLPARIADRGRLRVMLGSLAQTLHVGVLADCFFDPANALCLKATTDQSNPQPALCQPTKCPNACIRTRHLPAWQSAADNAKALLKEKRLSNMQRSALKNELDRIYQVIHENVS